MIAKLRYIFDTRSKCTIAMLLVMIVIGSFFEMLGVTVFLPFVQLLMNEDAAGDNWILAAIFGLISSDKTENRIIILALLIMTFFVIKNIYLTFLQNCILGFNYRTRMNLATKLLDSYLKEPYLFHVQKNSSELVRTLQTDCNQFMLLINGSLQLLAEGAVCIAIIAFLFFTSPVITIVVAGLLAICVGLYYIISKNVSLRIGLRNQAYNAKLFQWISQALGGIKEVKILGREQFFVDEYNTNYKKLIKGAKDNEMLAAVPKYITETVTMIGLLSAIIIRLIMGVEDLTVFVSQLTAFAVASFKLLPAIGKMNAYINSIMYSIPSLDVIYNDLKEVEAISTRKMKACIKEKNTFQEGITIDHVTFKYPNSKDYILNDVSFRISKGTTAAFIGSSGAGKTTMADIILGLLEPESGAVKVDGWDINDNQNSWHSMIGYIPQTIYLSDDSIASNVAFGIKRDEIDYEAVRDALKKAQLLDYVEGLPDGINTFVGDRGVRLSGGQRQRIGIARALYHNPEVLVLDEATSALDNETEKAVMDAIDSLKGEKTMLIIAHRLSTIKNADVVFEVNKGKVNVSKAI